MKAELRKRRTRFRITIGIAAFVILLTAGSLCVNLLNNTHAKTDETQNIVTATGVTEIGMEPVTFSIDFLEDTRLYVEEVYLSDGDTAAANEPYVKFTDESIRNARTELEQAVHNAELDYRSRVVSSGEDKIEAKYTYDTTVLEAEFAPQVYQDTLTQLDMRLAKAKNAYEEAQNEYNEYYVAVVNNTFYEDYEVEALKKAYDEAYDLFVSRRAYWEVTQEELDLLDDGSSAHAGQGERQWIVRTVALLRDEMTEAQNRYEQAKNEYQREIEGAELKLQKLLNQSEQAQQDLLDTQIAYQKESLHAKTVYEIAVARGQLAESDYNTYLCDLADELEHLRAVRDTAVENRALFEDLAGDGYLYTEQAGTVLMVQAVEGQALEGGSQILAYADEEEMSVTATVPRADAAKIFVGEKTSVTVEDCGSFDGVVEAIQPITGFFTPENKTPIYNLVRISLNGDVSDILPEQTAAVVFGEEMQGDTIECSAGGHSAVEREMIAQMYDFDILDETKGDQAIYLEADSVYVRAGQHIKEGDMVCRFTQESIERVRKALIDIQSDAGKALVRAQAGYHIGVLEAGLKHNEAVIDNTLAQMTYDNTIARLNSSLVSKILETEQLLADIYQLQTTLTDDAHQEKRADMTKAYEKAKKQVEKAKESFVTSQVEAAENLQTTKDSYEKFFAQLEASSQEIRDKVERVYALQEEILQSQQLMEKELLTAEQTRISAQTEGEIAYAKYAGILKEYENAVNNAQSYLEQSTHRLDAFEQFVGDGTIYATGDGLVIRIGCEKGDRIVDVRELVFYMPETAGKEGVR